MLTEEDDVEIHALKARGWTTAAIARHTGRDPKTIRKYLNGEGARRRRRPAPSCLEPWRGYLTARFDEDPHVSAVALFDELAAAGFDRFYPTLVRELRRLELRPVCLVCRQRRGRAPPRRSTTRPAKSSSSIGLSCRTPRGASPLTRSSARCRTGRASSGVV